MNNPVKKLKQDVQELHFNIPGFKAISFLAKDAILFLKMKFMQVLCFDVLAAILHAAAYILTLRALQTMEAGENIHFSPLGIEGISSGYHIFLLILIVLFLACAVELKYRSFTAVCAIWEQFSTRCTVQGVQAVMRQTTGDEPQEKNNSRQSLRRTIKRDAISTGFFAKKIAQILSALLQATVFLSVLLYLHITVTLVILVLCSILFAFYFQAYVRVARASNTRQEFTELSRDEIRNLHNDITSGNLTEIEVGNRIKSLLSEGNIGKFLQQKIYVQRGIKRGASLIEFASPLALLVMGIILFNTDYFDISISSLVVYYLVLKKVIAIAVQIGDDFITINRMHPNITNYLKLIGKI